MYTVLASINIFLSTWEKNKVYSGVEILKIHDVKHCKYE